MSKPTLYIDVDDTILFATEEKYVLRSRTEDLILELSNQFDCFWLTKWDEKPLQQFLAENAPALLACVKYKDWSEAGCKAAAVIAGPPDFWWLEDPFSTGSTKLLEQNGNADRYVVVNPFVEGGLSDAIDVLLQVRAARLC
jgi:hypothetical protein